MTWNSTLKRKTPLRARSREKRTKGLGYQVESILNALRPHGSKPINVLRSESHRRNVAALDCVVCGRAGPSQCAHINFGKGMALKACDSATFPACPDCHRSHDQGAVHTKTERWLREWEYVDWTRAELLKKNLWPRTVEAAYQVAIEPLARVVKS